MKRPGGLKRPALHEAMRMRTPRINLRRRQHGGRANRTNRDEYARDMYIQHRRGEVKWSNINRNGPILRAGMGVLCCQLDF